MKNDAFRPVSFWKSAILSAPDNSFFELLRSVFGKIKTPFSKQQLLIDLEKFLLREDIQKAIASYIDEYDAKIIAATALFGEPAPKQLESFFSGEYSDAQLQDIIVNLEERFILYRFTEDKTNLNVSGLHSSSQLALNPVLKTLLLPYTEDTSLLFPEVSTSEAADTHPAQGCKVIFNDLILAGVLSFSTQFDPFYRTESENKVCVIRKRVIEAGKTCFPGVDLTQLTNSLLILGLFYIDKDRLIPDRKRLDEFSLLTARERSEYFAAALLINKEISANEILPPLYRGRIRETVNLIHGFFDLLKEKTYYHEKTLRRIIEVLKVQTGVNVETEKILEAIMKTELITSRTAGLTQTGAIVHHKSSRNNKPVIALDSGFSILAYPEINFTDAVSIASFTIICETGASLTTPVSRFELNRDSAVNAYDNNISADEIIELLNRLSGKKADDTLVWNLKDWEKRHGEVTLRKGVILNLSEEHRYLTKTNPFKTLIKDTLAPGLYLLDEDAADDAESALISAGIDIIGQRKPEMSEDLKHSNNHFTEPATLDLQFSKLSFQSAVKPEKKSAGQKKSKQNTEDNTNSLIENFHVILEKMPLNETEKAELSARIDRRLILSETQLKDANLRYEKLEARHMDYAGKQNIAKQAITQQSPLEIVRLNKGTSGKNVTVEEEKIYGIPKALEKEGTQLILVLDTEGAANTKTDSQNGELLRIPLAKISLLRRIKKSIFEI